MNLKPKGFGMLQDYLDKPLHYLLAWLYTPLVNKYFSWRWLNALGEMLKIQQRAFHQTRLYDLTHLQLSTPTDHHHIPTVRDRTHCAV